MEVELGNNIVRAKRSKHIPVVFTKEEARLIISNLKGVYWLIANLLYGSGLRILECLRLRLKVHLIIKIEKQMGITANIGKLGFSA